MLLKKMINILPLIKIFFGPCTSKPHLFISFSNFPISKWGSLTWVLKATSSSMNSWKLLACFRKWRFQFPNTLPYRMYSLWADLIWILFFLFQPLFRVIECRHYSTEATAGGVPPYLAPATVLNTLHTWSHLIVAALLGSSSFTFYQKGN